MRVNWQGTNDLTMRQSHGWDFKLGHYMSMDGYKYIQWLVEEKSACLRVWVDDIIIWDYEKGWYNKAYEA